MNDDHWLMYVARYALSGKKRETVLDGADLVRRHRDTIRNNGWAPQLAAEIDEALTDPGLLFTDREVQKWSHAREMLVKGL